MTAKQDRGPSMVSPHADQVDTKLMIQVLPYLSSDGQERDSMAPLVRKGCYMKIYQCPSVQQVINILHL